MLITVVVVVVPASGPTGCLISSPQLSSQNVQSHMKAPASHWARDETQTMALVLGANCEGKERVEGKASRIESCPIGSALVCVRQNVQHRELKLPKSRRFVLVTVVMVVVFTSSGPTGCPVSLPPLSS